MGYYTMFNITVKSKTPTDFEDLRKYFVEEHNMPYGYAVNSFDVVDDFELEMCGDDIVKWYDNEEDMITISNKFPNYVFMVDGNGEEEDDFWKEYFYQGKSCYCPASIVYKEVDTNIIPWF